MGFNFPFQFVIDSLKFMCTGSNSMHNTMHSCILKVFSLWIKKPCRFGGRQWIKKAYDTQGIIFGGGNSANQSELGKPASCAAVSGDALTQLSTGGPAITQVDKKDGQASNTQVLATANVTAGQNAKYFKTLRKCSPQRM
jgi:hypothetical protein